MTDKPDHRANHARTAVDEQHAPLSTPNIRSRSTGSPLADVLEVDSQAVGTGSPPTSSKARVRVITDWPERFPITEAEVLLASSFFADLLSEASANDNQPRQDSE